MILNALVFLLLPVFGIAFWCRERFWRRQFSLTQLALAESDRQSAVMAGRVRAAGDLLEQTERQLAEELAAEAACHSFVTAEEPYQTIAA